MEMTSSEKPLSLQKWPRPMILKILSMEGLEGRVQLKMDFVEIE